MWTPELIAAVTFAAIVLMVVGPYYLLVLRSETAQQEMLRQRIRTGGGAAARMRATGAGLLKEVEKFSVFGPLNTMLGSSGTLAANLRKLTAQTGTKVTPGQVVLGSACLGLLIFSAVQIRFANVWLSLALGVAAGTIPYVVLRIMRARRLNQFEAQFPEAVDLIARTLRAGHAFPTGLKMAAEELPQPVAAEFRVLFDQQNFGMPIPEALRNFADRTPLIDARFFVTAVLTQREAGGNLAEVLDNLSEVIRERFKIKRQLRVISAHGRLTGAILASLPPFLAVYMMIRMPKNFGVLLTDPLGIKMLIFAVVMQLIGALIIRKITSVEY